MTNDKRFTVPLYTHVEVAQHVRVAPSTVDRWANERAARAPLMHEVKRETPKSASVPFIALHEALVLRAFRDAGVTMPRIRETVAALRREFDDAFALARNDLATDGVEIVRRLQAKAGRKYYVPRTGQLAIAEVLEDCLTFATWKRGDLYPVRLKLTAYEGADVIVDTRFGFGQPVFAESKVRVEDVVDLFFAGESIRAVAREYGVDAAAVEAAVRAAGAAGRAA